MVVWVYGSRNQISIFAKILLDNDRSLCYYTATMLMIRLQRVGRANDPSFRLVVTEKRNATKSGKFLEVLGSYNARKGKAQLDRDRIKHWLGNGVKLSATAHNMLANHKLVTSVRKGFANKPKKVETTVIEAVKEAAAEAPVA